MKTALGSSDIEKSKQSISSLFFACMSITITLAIFGPIELYLTNINEFWFTFREFWWIVLLAGFALFTIFFAIGTLLRGKFRTIYTNLVIGLAFAFYVQGNWINTDYGVLDGKSIQWDEYSRLAIINTFIWIACLLLPFILQKLFKNIHKKIIKYTAIFIVAIQIFTMGILMITVKENKKGIDTAYLSTNDEFSLSNENNIVIFVLDAFDSSYFKELLDTYEELDEAFKDFTYYPDTAAAAARTKVALPAILTGVPYTVPLSYNEYIDYAYEQTNLYRTLNDLGYGIGIYTPGFVSTSHIDIVDNFVSDGSKVSSYSLLAKYMYQSTAFKYMPHLLKRYFWLYSGVFQELQIGTGAQKYSTNSVEYYQRLLQNKVSVSNMKGAFRFYYIDGPHPPFYMNEYAQKVSPDETDQIKQARGSLYIVEEYMKQLKEAGVYDKTSIIILADHGDIALFQNPLFMLKLAGEAKSFETSYLPVSYYDLNSILMKLIDNRQTGNDILDYNEGDKRTRYFYRDTSKNNSTTIVEYKIEGPAWDSNSVSATGKIYSGNAGEMENLYKYGTKLTFGPDGTAMPFFAEGFSGTNAGKYNWTDGKTAKMIFDLGKAPEQDLKVILYTMVYNRVGSQRMVVKSAGEIVHLGEYSNTSNIEFFVPKELVRDKQLVLDFEFPDAVCPLELFGRGNDSRTLAFAFLNLTIMEEEIVNRVAINVYRIGDKIEFTENNNGSRYFINGISKVENGFAWSSGRKSWFIAKIDNSDDDLLCEIKFTGVFNKSQRLIITTNGTVLFDDVVSSDNKTVQFVIPSEFLSSNLISITFDYPDAASPAELGTGKDKRVLAFAYKSITFSVTADNENSIQEPGTVSNVGKIDFSSDGNNNNFLVKDTDWHAQEQTHRWTGKYAELIVPINADNDIVLFISGYVHPSSGGCTVMLNNTVIDELEAGTRYSRYEITVSKELIGDSGKQTIAFSSKDAKSPYQSGTGEDKRELGIALSSIIIDIKSAVEKSTE